MADRSGELLENFAATGQPVASGGTKQGEIPIGAHSSRSESTMTQLQQQCFG
jgi:hypothetical protein